MFHCKTFDNYDLDYLEIEINDWFEDMKMKKVVMHDVQFHYAVKKNEYSVLISYRVEEEVKG